MRTVGTSDREPGHEQRERPASMLNRVKRRRDSFFRSLHQARALLGAWRYPRARGGEFCAARTFDVGQRVALLS